MKIEAGQIVIIHTLAGAPIIGEVVNDAGNALLLKHPFIVAESFKETSALEMQDGNPQINLSFIPYVIYAKNEVFSFNWQCILTTSDPADNIVNNYKNIVQQAYGKIQTPTPEQASNILRIK